MEIADGIWTVKNFFSEDECAEWIAFAEELGFDEAPISAGIGKEKIQKDVRNNNRAMLDDEDRAFTLWQQAKKHVPQMIYHRVALGLNERLRFYRYDSSQKFSWHADGFFRRNNGEQSLLTLMVYLNEDFEGGETVFSGEKTVEVVPETGTLLFFRHELFHEGSIVRTGRKYVLRTDVMFSP